MARTKSDSKDQALVEAAIQLFLSRGIKSTRVQDIAAQAKVAVGTVYTYFGNKKAIVKRVAAFFAVGHGDMAARVLFSEKPTAEKLHDYILGLYDMWKPFGENSVGARELAEAILHDAPEYLRTAQDQYKKTIEEILKQGQGAGLKIDSVKEDTRCLMISTIAFFPLAGTPSEHPFHTGLTREDLSSLLKWMGKRYS